MSTDSDILRRSLGVPEAFGELFDRHARAVHRFAARRADAAAADDVLSETFLVAFERRAAFDHRSDDARPWLLGIATVLLRKRARLDALAWRGIAADFAATLAEDAVERSDARLDAGRLAADLRGRIERLPARDREALLLYAMGDLDYAGVALALDIPIGTVRSRLNRARRVLRAGLPTGPEAGHGRTAAAAPGA